MKSLHIPKNQPLPKPHPVRWCSPALCLTQHDSAQRFTQPFAILDKRWSLSRRDYNLNETKETNKTWESCSGGREVRMTDEEWEERLLVARRFFDGHWPNRMKRGNFLFWKSLALLCVTCGKSIPLCLWEMGAGMLRCLEIPQLFSNGRCSIIIRISLLLLSLAW